MDTELQQLKDIHLPHAISTWPIAPGWIILYILLLVLFVYLLYLFYQRKQKNRIIKFALLRLDELKKLSFENPDNTNIAAEISILIRRTALCYFRREQIAGLSGNDWLFFLNQSGNTSKFTGEFGRLLIDAPYRKNNISDLAPLLTLTKDWLMTLKKPLKVEK